MKKLVAITLLFVLSILTVSAETISGNRLPEGVKPIIDGKLGDAAWEKAFFIETKFISADNKKPVQNPTRAWLCYDDNNIYVALEDIKKGEKIVARETKDDNNALFRDDLVSWSFNAFKTTEGHLDWWTVNPNGAKMANFSQGVANKPEWSDWVVKVGKTQDGWCAEMQVPWTLINLPKHEGTFIFWVNFDSRDDGRLAYWKYGGSDNPAGNWAEWQVELKPISEKIGVKNSRRTRQTKILSELFAEKFQREKPSFSLGATAQRNSLTLTAFPEWRTLEGPIEGLDPVWGERYYREYRPFFQEGIGVAPPGDFYYSQRIQDIDFGLNYTKSLEKFQIATIDTVHRGGKYTANIRGAFLPTKSSNVSGGYLFDRRLQNENNVYYLTAQQRWKPLGLSGWPPLIIMATYLQRQQPSQTIQPL
ncbi:MAG: hypothetical protein NTV62_03735 [Candidatus Gribaldobacteria bacterium]|nr:hypothetical protein [Candidatus Gribaldobacteria bacterium]